MDKPEAELFLRRMRHHVGLGGRAIIGIDLVKSVGVLRAAYDDAQGVTAAFNRNLLVRVNRELNGNFPLDHFQHLARWNEREKSIEMHLVCGPGCAVVIEGTEFSFAPGESIHTESSRKYSFEGIRVLAENTGWTLDHIWTDNDGAFAVVGLSVVG